MIFIKLPDFKNENKSNHLRGKFLANSMVTILSKNFKLSQRNASGKNMNNKRF